MAPITVWKLGVMRRMLSKNPDDRPTESKLLQELGGAKDYCFQERGVFEAEADTLLWLDVDKYETAISRAIDCFLRENSVSSKESTREVLTSLHF
jgi:hypothetical protein